jgi:hypothetical protein
LTTGRFRRMPCSAYALEGLGQCAVRLHDDSTADRALHQALAIYRQLGTADADRLFALTSARAGAGQVAVPVA